MKPQIIKADIAGCTVKFPNEETVYYVGDSCPPLGNGICYKDRKAFDEHVGICYIPEYDFMDEPALDKDVSSDMREWMEKNFSWHVAIDNGYTRDGIYAAADEAIDAEWQEQMEKEYGKAFFEGFIDHIAQVIFDTVDWQHPETYAQELDIDEEWEYYLKKYDDPRLTDKQKKELGYE